ncbi:hypothetical protein ACMFHC_27510 (plasmid) [Klebsiella pneumoniae]|uniref:hypothetical protein n=1 Tax=Klebsiella pneumoniae TaxID=573 RepID=UPI002542988F|nr:hypothetical protein [Klebsiella pneumoniae]
MMTFAPHASISTIALGTSAPACCQVAGRDDWPSELDANGYSVACSSYEREKSLD